MVAVTVLNRLLETSRFSFGNAAQTYIDLKSYPSRAVVVISAYGQAKNNAGANENAGISLIIYADETTVAVASADSFDGRELRASASHTSVLPPNTPKK